MAVSDEDLARAKNLSVQQIRLLRDSRGTTNQTLEAVPDAVLRQALHRLAYPDRPGLRTEFRFRQATGDGGAGPPPQQATETAVLILCASTSQLLLTVTGGSSSDCTRCGTPRNLRISCARSTLPAFRCQHRQFASTG
jgi:hypothetical protein